MEQLPVRSMRAGVMAGRQPPRSHIRLRPVMALPWREGGQGKKSKKLTDGFEGGKHLYDCSGRRLVDARRLVIWEGNRTPDPARLDELALYIADKGWVPGVIQVFTRDLKARGKSIDQLTQMYLHIWDGGHRYEATRRVVEEHGIDPQLHLSVWYLDPETPDSTVRSAMEANEKRIVMPEAYVAQEAQQKLKAVSEGLAKDMQIKCPQLVSGKQTCRPPHFIRDRLQDSLYTLMDQARLGGSDLSAQPLQETMWALMWDLNEDFKNAPNSLKPPGVKKVAECGCYLFAKHDGLHDFSKALREIMHAHTDQLMGSSPKQWQSESR